MKQALLGPWKWIIFTKYWMFYFLDTKPWWLDSSTQGNALAQESSQNLKSALSSETLCD